MKLGVIGCGKMGTALVEGAIRSGAVAAADVSGVDPLQGARDHFTNATGAAVAAEISTLAGCDVILLCTKPHDVADSLREISIAGHATPGNRSLRKHPHHSRHAQYSGAGRQRGRRLLPR